MDNHVDAIALAALIIGVFGWLKSDISSLSKTMSHLSERVAKLEGQMQILVAALVPNGSRARYEQRTERRTQDLGGGKQGEG